MLLAENDLSDVEIAREIGVNPRTLIRWKQNPEFSERIDIIRDQIADQIRAEGIANRKNRVGMLDDLASRLYQLIEARGREMASRQDAPPGGALGLLVEQTRVIGQGQNQQVITEHQYDSAVVRDLSGLLKQAAQEMGQWMPAGPRGEHQQSMPGLNLPAEGIDHRTLLFEEVMVVRRRLIASGVPVLDPDGQVIVQDDPFPEPPELVEATPVEQEDT